LSKNGLGLFWSPDQPWLGSFDLQHRPMDKFFAALQTAADISKTAIDNSDQLAVEAVDLFLALIGAEAGHMGLRSLASGGIYICGGIMPKVSQHCWTIVTNIYAHMGAPKSQLLK